MGLCTSTLLPEDPNRGPQIQIKFDGIETRKLEGSIPVYFVITSLIHPERFDADR